jgi:hypothetical protein
MVSQLWNSLSSDLPKKRTMGAGDLDQSAKNFGTELVEVFLSLGEFSQPTDDLTDFFLDPVRVLRFGLC